MYIQLTKKLKIMKKFICKHKTLWISIMVAASIIALMDSCSSPRYGCPVNASHGFGPGRMR
jgi:hypothetical protein